MPGILISGLDANGAVHPVEVDDNGNLRVDLVSGVSVSTVIDQTNSLAVFQVSGAVDSVNVVSGSVTIADHSAIDAFQASGSAYSVATQAVGLNETNEGVLRTTLMTDCVASVNVVSGSVTIADHSAIDAFQASGSAYSIATASLGLNETNDGVLRAVLMTDSVTSVNIVSGSASGTEYTEEETAGPGEGALAMGVADANGSIYAFRIGAGLSDRALRVAQAVDSVSSVNIVSGSTAGTEYSEGATVDPGQGSLAMAVTGASGSTYTIRLGSGDSITALRTIQAIDSISSVNVVSGFIDALQVSGANYSVEATSAAKGLNETTDGVLRTVLMTDSVSSVNCLPAVAGLNETGAGVLRAVLMTDSVSSAQVKGIARQTNPSAATDAAIVSITADDLGRTITRPIQVRDLIATAYASITTGTEATLATAAAGTYLDLIYVMATCESDAAVTVDIRPVAAGGIVASIRVPANGTAGVALPVPFPMTESGNAWTADIPDITGTTVTVSALFSKEV